LFFGVLAKAQTWRSIGYLLLAFPLGIFYLVFLVTGFSLGLGLFVTLLGIPVLVGVIAASYGLGEFERLISNQLLEISIPRTGRISRAGGFWEKLKALVVSSETWKRVFYLFLKFPFGIVGFVFVVVAFSLLAQIIAPFVYQENWYNPNIGTVWQLDELWEAIVLAVVGVILGFGFLHLINGTAQIWGLVAKALLSPTPGDSDDSRHVSEA
jgi:hypothetical protein